jgi:hypothetical protein
MHVVAPRAVAQPHAHAAESAAAIDGVAQASAAAVTQRRIPPAGEGDGVAQDRRQPREGHELRARDMEVRTAKAMREPDGTIVDLLPTYEYEVGPDGVPYVIGQGESPMSPRESPTAPIEADAPVAERAIVERAPVDRESVDREPVDREPVDREPPPASDDHVTRSYTKLVAPETPPKLDTIA